MAIAFLIAMLLLVVFFFCQAWKVYSRAAAMLAEDEKKHDEAIASLKAFVKQLEDEQ